MIIVKSDISAEHRARSEGEAAELRFRQVFEQSPIGLCLVRPDGTFERVNHTFEEITGYSAEELTGMTFADITHPDDLDQDLELSGAMFRGATDSFEMEKRYIRKGGDVVWVHLTVDDARRQPGQPYDRPVDGPGRHRAPRAEPAAAAPGGARSADRALQPPPVRGGALPDGRGRPGERRARGGGDGRRPGQLQVRQRQLRAHASATA